MEKKIIAIITTCSVAGTFLLVGTGFLVHRNHPQLFKPTSEESTTLPSSPSEKSNESESESYYNFLNTNRDFRSEYSKLQTQSTSNPNLENTSTSNSFFTPNSKNSSNPNPKNTFIPNSNNSPNPNPKNTFIPNSENSSIPDFKNTTVPNFKNTTVPNFKNTTVPNFKNTTVPNSKNSSAPNPKNSSNPNPANSPTFNSTFNTRYVKECFLDKGYSRSDAAILSNRYLLEKMLGIPNNYDDNQLKQGINDFTLKYHPDKRAERGLQPVDESLSEFIGVLRKFYNNSLSKNVYKASGLSCTTEDINIILSAYKALFPTTQTA